MCILCSESKSTNGRRKGGRQGKQQQAEQTSSSAASHYQQQRTSSLTGLNLSGLSAAAGSCSKSLTVGRKHARKASAESGLTPAVGSIHLGMELSPPLPFSSPFHFGQTPGRYIYTHPFSLSAYIVHRLTVFPAYLCTLHCSLEAHPWSQSSHRPDPGQLVGLPDGDGRSGHRHRGQRWSAVPTRYSTTPPQRII